MIRLRLVSLDKFDLELQMTSFLRKAHDCRSIEQRPTSSPQSTTSKAIFQPRALRLAANKFSPDFIYFCLLSFLALRGRRGWENLHSGMIQSAAIRNAGKMLMELHWKLFLIEKQFYVNFKSLLCAIFISFTEFEIAKRSQQRVNRFLLCST